MPKQGHTDIICILDRSGSMGSIKNDAIGGFNTFIEAQRKVPGTATVTLVLFDNEYLVPYSNVDIRQVNLLDDSTFVPRGNTALFDAIGKTVNDTNERIGKMADADKPEKVIVCILTDGEENASHEFKNHQIKEMIEKQRSEKKWEFAFLAANQDAFTAAKSMGISQDYTSGFVSDSKGTKAAYLAMSSMTKRYRTDPTNN